MEFAKTFIFMLPLIASFGLYSSEALSIGIKNPKIRPAVHKKILGVVNGVRSCGGPGQLIQWRYESCRDTDAPCHAPADGSLKRAEVDFIPSRDISSLGLRLKVKSEDGTIDKAYNFNGPIFNASVKKGQPYTIANAGGVSSELKGKLALFQYILYDENTNQVEICAESEFLYV